MKTKLVAHTKRVFHKTQEIQGLGNTRKRVTHKNRYTMTVGGYLFDILDKHIRLDTITYSNSNKHAANDRMRTT